MSSPDFANLFSQLPTKMVGIAVVVAPLTQYLKLRIPQLSGWRALGVNFALTSVASLSVCPDPAQLQTAAFWGGVVASSLAAAGIHGTGKSLGLFTGLFTLPPEYRDPLKFACPHVENDWLGRPDWTCPAIPGERCTDRAGQPCPPHVERLALTEGGGQPMSKGVAEAAAEDAGIAPLLGLPDFHKHEEWPMRIYEAVEREAAHFLAHQRLTL